jgi:hypothetical protein
MFANLDTSAPVYTSGALIIAAGLLVIILPFEPQGKASLRNWDVADRVVRPLGFESVDA